MNLPPGLWERVEALFDQALDQPSAERARWVREAAAGDSALAEEVLAMLAAHDTANGVLDRPLPVSLTPQPPDLATALAERYRIEEQIGEGGMATVHLARAHTSDRKVVIKVLKPAAAIWFGSERFRKEVALATRLVHPHILGLIDSGETEGFLYYVMPYLGGETLRTRLARSGRLSARDALPLLRGLAEALVYAHSEGVVHRDLKPENVLCIDSHAWLMDFGIARLASTFGAQTAAGTVIGTPGYMSPEQENGRTVDHRADLWAWGVVARECLSGSRGQDPPATGPGTSRLLLELIEKCLRRDPESRMASASELVAALATAR
jgi:serine/threonine-protein kinase